MLQHCLASIWLQPNIEVLGELDTLFVLNIGDKRVRLLLFETHCTLALHMYQSLHLLYAHLHIYIICIKLHDN